MKFIDESEYEKIKQKRICILSGTGKTTRASKLEMLAEIDTEETSRELVISLLKSGFKHVDFLVVTEDNLPALKFLEPDVFINLTEGERSEFCARVYQTIFPLGIPITGSSAETIEKTTNKHLAKLIMEENLIPTPPGIVVDNIPSLSNLPTNLTYPLILKPVYEDGSTGIHQKSVVVDREELKKVTADYLKKYNQPVLIEKYIDSREFSPTVCEIDGKPQLLPLTEITYDQTSKKRWNINCYKSKWQKTTEIYKKTSCQTPAKNLSPKDYKIIHDYCIKVFKVFKIGDYARFDIRYDEVSHIPYFLDLNTNPSLENNTMYALYSSVRAAGLSLPEFVALIIKSSFQRFNKEI